MFRNIIGTRNDAVVAVLRLILGIVFFAHGAQKMLGWFGGYGYAGTMGYFSSLGIPAVFGALAILTEFLGGISLVIGLLGRVAAAAVIVDMLVAIMLVHLPNGLFMNWGLAVVGQRAAGEGYEFHLLAIAMALAVLIKGSGALSVDRALSHSNA